MKATQLDFPYLYRLLKRVDFTGACWEWTGPLNQDGYGRVIRRGRGHQLHRYVWEHLVGPIAPGLQLDHLCKNTRCCNPDHLEPVTPQENIRRSASRATLNAAKTHCSEGHPFDDENTYYYKNRNGRGCKICRRATTKAWRASHRNDSPA